MLINIRDYPKLHVNTN